MNALRLATPLVLIALACSPAWSYGSVQLAQEAQPDTRAPTSAAAQDPHYAAPKADTPVITVGVSDPNTQLILPWFLTDIINAVNSHSSADEFLHNVGRGM
jgi:hypothetical protein